MKSLTIYGLIVLLLIQTTACKKNYTDPSKVPVEDALTTQRGLTGLAVGLQRVYTFGRASSLYNYVTIDGFITKQLNILNKGNTAEDQLYQGGAIVDPTNTVLTAMWTNSNKVIFDANNVLKNAPTLADRNYASGLIAYASIFKAMALGNLAMFWNQVPDTIGKAVGFINSVDGYKKAANMLDAALDSVTANPISAQFLANVPVGIDIVNTLHALKARYSLFAGLYADAFAEAGLVDLSKKSTLNFDAVVLNPIYETAAGNTNVYQPIDATMGLPPALQPAGSDKRVPFYITTVAGTVPYRIAGFAGTTTAAWPIYLPGEIILIQAEVNARQNQIPDAIVRINQVRNKKPNEDPFGVGGDQPAYTGGISQAALLEEIYRQRAIELYMSGLRLEDQRRLGRPEAERKRSFMPYPFAERDNNPNTPTDPVF